MQWTSDAIAKLFMHVLKIHDVKIDYVAVAAAMGEDCTPKALSHQISKLKKMVDDQPTGDPGQSTPAKQGSLKRSRNTTPKSTAGKNTTPKAKAKAAVPNTAATGAKNGTPLEDVNVNKGEEGNEDEVTETPSKKLKVSNADAGGEHESSINVTPTPKRKGRVVKGEGHKPTSAMAKYNTDHYNLYDINAPNAIAAYEGPFTKYADYDSYELYINPNLTDVNAVPTSGVRIDDLTISRVLLHFKAAKLCENWPADFDKQGMVRASRVPLGLAAKMWVDVGATDVNGNVVGEDQQGYYYKWYRGVHCLMGKEGMDAGMYVQRPNGEKPLCQGFGFKVDFKAVVQEAEDKVDGDDGSVTEDGNLVEAEETGIKGEEGEDEGEEVA